MKNIPPFTINLVCLFCRTELHGNEGKTYSSGDLIKCQECEEENDYDSLVAVAKEKGVAQVKEKIEKQLKVDFKKLFKKF